MGYLGLLMLLAIGLPDSTMNKSSQVAQISISEENETAVFISHRSEWRYHPGDNLEWANPEFDDSDWLSLTPSSTSITELPDSLWPGYGWWRFTFQADSAFYEQNWNLYFSGWGAAEVYLDGNLLYNYGKFSTKPEDEQTYTAYLKTQKPVSMKQKSQHTLAIRYSFHKAKKYQSLFFEKAENYDRSKIALGFIKHTYNENIIQARNVQIFVLSFSASALFILLLIHITLYIKFRDDQSNLLVSILIGLLLISCLSVYAPVYLEMTLAGYLLSEEIWVTSALAAFLLIPYVIASIFRISTYKKSIYLLYTVPVALAIYHFSLFDVYILVAVLYLLSFLLTGLCIRKAYLLQKKGVVYVALGALGALVFTLIYTFYELGFFEFSFLLYLNTVLIYTFFPFGLTLYIANRYGYLFGTMENEVKARTMELEEAYSELQKSMEDLKATQSQLIQQEKLASLGQLTAGIAHEIKNPLNFVNNFSELSIELIEEAREEIQNSEVLEILDNIEANLRKIHEHGSRADGIVKSMLLHSRGKSGESIPTDVNKLLDEYVNLAYHGMRAVDKSFNIDIQTDFDSTIGMMDVVAQDLSRAFLNIINNAMYAASEYSRRHNKRKPVVSVQTTKNGSKVEVRIRDNGGGIPEKIRAKIFEPFFTTKPTGEGTGLGLSMTFDIIKMHKGTLEVESTPGEFTEFIITLPLITKNGDSK